MEKEDYVSLQVAKLLKEKGFNEICSAAYSIEDENINPLFYGTFQNYGDGYVAGHIAAPTLYEAANWLRENYNIHVTIDFDESQLWGYSIQECNDKDSFITNDSLFNSYEEALDAGIIKALKMI